MGKQETPSVRLLKPPTNQELLRNFPRKYMFAQPHVVGLVGKEVASKSPLLRSSLMLLMVVETPRKTLRVI